MTAERQPQPEATPEQAPDESNENYSSHNENVPGFLQVENIDAMRDAQYVALQQRARELGLDHRMSDEERAQIVEEIVAGTMRTSGLQEEDDPRYQEAHGFLRGVSVDRIDGDWGVNPQDPTTGEYLPSERQNAENYIARHFAWETDEQSEPVSPENTPEEPTHPEDEEESTDEESSQEEPTTPEDNPVTEEPTDEELRGAMANLTPEQHAQVDRLYEQWKQADVDVKKSRDEYLRLRAGNARRAVHIRKEYRNSSVKEARDEYEANLVKMYRIMNEALEITQEGEAILNAEAIGQERALAARYREHRLVATGNYEFNAQGKMIEVQRGFVGRQMNKFYNWYGSVNAGGKTFSKGGLKKAGVLGVATGVVGGVAGLAAGAVLAPVGGVVIAGLGAGYLANRITKAYMATHINKKSHDVTDQHAQLQHDELIADHENESDTRSMADIIDDQAKREVRRNKKRAALTIGTMAVSTTLGGVAGGLIHDKFFDRNNTAYAAAQATEGEGTPDDGGKLPVATPGETAGFQTAVNVEAGHGYAHEISDLFAQKGIHLSPAQSYEAYQHLEQKFPGGNFFTDNNSYSMGGDYGIGRSGSSHWNEAVVRDLDAWAKARNLG